MLVLFCESCSLAFAFRLTTLARKVTKAAPTYLTTRSAQWMGLQQRERPALTNSGVGVLATDLKLCSVLTLLAAFSSAFSRLIFWSALVVVVGRPSGHRLLRSRTLLDLLINLSFGLSVKSFYLCLIHFGQLLLLVLLLAISFSSRIPQLCVNCCGRIDNSNQRR